MTRPVLQPCPAGVIDLSVPERGRQVCHNTRLVTRLAKPGGAGCAPLHRLLAPGNGLIFFKENPCR